MSEAGPALVFQSTHRRSEFLLGMLALTVLAMAGGGALAWLLARSPWLETFLIAWLAVILACPVVMILGSLRVHSWSVEPRGIRIHERPKIPLTGRKRAAFVPFAEMAGLNHREAGFVAQVELAARDGRRFLLDQGHHKPGASGIGRPDHEGFAAFLAEVRAAAQAAGYPLADGQALSFWNRAGGLAIQVLLLLTALALAGTTAWAVSEGAEFTGRRRWFALALVGLLPVGAALLLRKSLRRRWAVLAAAPTSPGGGFRPGR